jgi:hypothetical protein
MFCGPVLIFGGSEGVGSCFHALRTRKLFQRYGGRWVLFSYFTLPNSFSAFPRASGPFFTFCAPELIFSGTDGIGSCFHVLRSRTCFRRCGGRRVSFSCFACTFLISTVTRASGPIFMFCAPGHVFGGIGALGPVFMFLHSRTRFRRFRGRQIPFSYFASPYAFSAVARASGLVFMLCAPRLICGGSEGVGSTLHVLRSRTCFRR